MNTISRDSSRDQNNWKTMRRAQVTSGKVTVHIKFNAAGEMARIASARTKSRTAAIERSLRAKLKEAKQYNSDKNTIRAIKWAIGKAHTKFKALAKEERMENQKKAAKSSGSLREEQRIEKELIKKRNGRKRKERAEVLNMMSLQKKAQTTENEENRSAGINVACDDILLLESAETDLIESVVDVCV